MMPRAYLAGPDVFLPEPAAFAFSKAEICARHNMRALLPIGENPVAREHNPPWEQIFARNLVLMKLADCIIANLTPYQGVSADVGTALEVGYFLGADKPIFAYSNSRTLMIDRARTWLCHERSGLMARMTLEDFGLPDNLMLPGAVLRGGGYPILLPEEELPFDSLEMFKRCVRLASNTFGVTR